MSRRIPIVLALSALLLTAACTNKKVNNPIANIDSKQPDKVLFDRAMDAMKHNRFDVARLTLQTMINTYPDSEFVARAKLAVADSWYAEGGTASLTQAEIEYKDFITFFPNMPEAAEAQLKIANIHYQQMEKPDRDYTHAVRAETEYRQLIMQWPDSKLVPDAKQRLREVQEVIAQREFGVGRFYYLRQSYPAAVARLRSLVEKYPLYSRADDALYLLGQCFEGEIAMTRSRPTCSGTPPRPVGCFPENLKADLIERFGKLAAEDYSRIITRYPVMDRAEDAKARLLALHQPVPKPTKSAVAQNKAEEDSRKDASMLSKVMGNFGKHPSVAEAARVGEPTLVDPTPVNATEVVQQMANAGVPASKSGSEGHTLSVETAGEGGPGPDQAVPRSDAPPVENSAAPTAQSGANELKPSVGPTDANELKPNVTSANGEAQPPQQVNEIQPVSTGAAATASSGSELADDATVASSKRKKKKGIRKIVPF
ncbi:MAG: outer membrane protein assembly factor BamD [Acidobacteriia bacterium]|nr:outer membrane protein assembly factor BamD [Terriglobia bacterium]